MNANDVLRGYELHTAEGGRLTEEEAVIVAALKLKAAAESNDGTTPETDAVNDSMAGAQGWVTYTPMAPLARRLERERNGLAARVAEYESTDLCGPGGPCKALASSYAALAERDAELARLRARLEIDFAVDGNGKRVPFPDGAPDGIACRDETIRLLEAELARLKAPVDGEIAEVASRLRAANPKSALSVCDRAAALIESLAARNAELFEQVAALTEERDWYSTANERAERAEAALAESERKIERLKYHADDVYVKARRVANGHNQIAAVGALTKSLDAYHDEFK